MKFELTWPFPLKPLAVVLSCLVLVISLGCGKADEEEESSEGGNAVGGTMQISVPSPFQMDVVEFVDGAGASLGQVENLEGTIYEFADGDRKLRFEMEKRTLDALDSMGQSLFKIKRDKDWVNLTVGESEDAVWRVKYSGADIEIYLQGDTPAAILRWAENQLEMLDADEKVIAVASGREGNTIFENGEGVVQFEAKRMSDPLALAILGMEELDLDQRVGMSVFLAGQ